MEAQDCGGDPGYKLIVTNSNPEIDKQIEYDSCNSGKLKTVDKE